MAFSFEHSLGFKPSIIIVKGKSKAFTFNYDDPLYCVIARKPENVDIIQWAKRNNATIYESMYQVTIRFPDEETKLAFLMTFDDTPERGHDWKSYSLNRP